MMVQQAEIHQKVNPKLVLGICCFMGVVVVVIQIFIFGPPVPVANYYYSSRRVNSSSIGMNNTATTLLHTRLPDYAMPENPRMYFIHIGKAGGVTLYKALNIVQKKAAIPCRMNKTRDGLDDMECYRLPSVNNESQSQISRHVLSHFHLGSPAFTAEEKAWLLNNTNVFLYTIRDPIDRIVSAFYYHKNEFATLSKKIDGFQKGKEFHVNCFPGDIGNMINALRYSGNETSITKCKRLAEQVMKGQNSAGVSHFKYNYQYYHDYTLGKQPNHTIAVIRMENMWDDVIKLDRMLGGAGNDVKGIGTQHTHGSERYSSSSNKTLSFANTLYLCCLMYKEIDVYQTLVLRASNLNATQKEETLSKLLDHCHVREMGSINIPFPWLDLYSKTNQCKNWNISDES